jgi:hypothetical protein
MSVSGSENIAVHTIPLNMGASIVECAESCDKELLVHVMGRDNEEINQRWASVSFSDPMPKSKSQ